MENVKLNDTTINRHIICDFHGIKNANKFDKIDVMRDLLLESASKAKMNVVGDSWKKFEPQGLTGVLILSTSHISCHFWPEKSFLHIDVFTCGNEGDGNLAVEHIKKILKPDMSQSKIMFIDRSIFNEQKPFGKSLLIDAYGCKSLKALDSIDTAYDFLTDLTKAIGMTKQSEPSIVRTDAEAFPDKKGLSGSIFLVESGIMLHTISTPDKRFITIDVYSCKNFDPKIVKKMINKYYKPKVFSKEQFLDRGIEYHYYSDTSQ